MPPKISVVVVSRDKRSSLSMTIDALTDQSLGESEYEIIIVDDGSKKDDLNTLAREKSKSFKNIHVVRQRPTGLAAGRNLGAKNAHAQIVAYTDNDCLPEHEWLEELLAVFNGKSVVGAEGKIVTDSPRTPFTNAPENLSGGKFVGANSAYLKEVIRKAGWYNEGMNFWREDTEFAFRAMKLGKIVFARNAVVYHPLRKDLPLSVFRYLFFLRNEWICFFKQPVLYVKHFGLHVLRDFFHALLAFFFLAAFVLTFALGHYALTIVIVIVRILEDFEWTMIFNRKVRFSTQMFCDYLAIGVLNWVKYIAYPLFALYGFIEAIHFTVVRK